MDDSIFALELLDAGAQDYVVKGDMSPDALDRAIRYAIQRQQNLLKIRELLLEVQEKGELLERKNQKLEKLYRQAHEFVDNVSHEFRTPLTVIKEYVALLYDGVVSEPDEQLRLLRVVEDRADDLNIMVDDMLDVSKLEAGMLGAWRRDCSVEEVLRNVAPSLQRKADLKNVKLEWEMDTGLPELYCDAEKVGRVITNLVMNAIKFCGNPGLVRIAAVADQPLGQVVFAISDNGPGISEDARTLIFERFKQLNANVRSSTKGFGLGLNIAKELVDLNFGGINVQSDLGVGSTFSFSIPISDPLEITRRYISRVERIEEGNSQLSAVIATVDEDVEHETANGVDGFLNCCLRKNDLMLRLEVNRWLIVIPEPECELQRYLHRIRQELTDENRNRPLGELPDISMQSQGTWRLQTEKDEILRCIESLAQTQVVHHVP